MNELSIDMTSNILTMPQVPFYSSADILSALSNFDTMQIVSDAYTFLYDSSCPPIKYVMPHGSENQSTVVMPYEDKPKGIFVEKVVFMDRSRKPGVTGYISIYDKTDRRLIAVVDATALTGLRTAAKSLLFSNLYFSNGLRCSPRTIHIYGSSTQAYYHAVQFAKRYPQALVRVIARSQKSMTRLENDLKGHAFENCIACLEIPDSEIPDVIITATSSVSPIITGAIHRSTRLIIAVGSSRGDQTEIDPNIVAGCSHYVDSRMSIDGKGEYKIPIEKGLIKRQSVNELIDVIAGGHDYIYGKEQTALFVSKGLIIEDYMFIARALGLR